MMKAIVRSLIALPMLALCAFAQFETAVVLGTVRDASQSNVASAKVTLLNIETGIQAETNTDDSGNYLFPNVKIGRYRISVEKAGFAPAASDTFRADVNARQRVDVTLNV